MNLLAELNEFYSHLKSYKDLLNKLYNQAFKTESSRGFNKPYDNDMEKREQIIREINSEREYLTRSSGRLVPHITELTGKSAVVIYIFGKPQSFDMWQMGLSEEFDYRIAEAFNACVDNTNAALGKLESDVEKGLRDKQGNLIEKKQDGLEPPKAFIAHGPPSQALNKLCRFLTALGIKPLVIEQESYQSRSVNEQVEVHLKEAHCAIVLGTADDKELKDGKLYPRRNVHIEIGRFQERFPNKTIYLLQENAFLPSDISEKLHTRFTNECMDEALIRVAIELKAFRLIKAQKADTVN